MGIN
jgi:hypothetical protein